MLSLSTIVERTSPDGHDASHPCGAHRQGYVEQDLRDPLYQLGFKVLQLRGTVINEAMRMASEVRPELYTLVARHRPACPSRHLSRRQRRLYRRLSRA